MADVNKIIIQFDDDSDTAYGLTEDGVKFGEIRYIDRTDYYDAFHTEIYSDFEGKGYAGKFASAFFNELKNRGTKVFPRCPFLSGYIEKHEEFKDLVF